MKLILIFVCLWILLVIAGIIIEKQDYNKGVCKFCGTKLRRFDTDSQGGRGYVCDKCDYYTWVSYHIIDRNHTNE